MKSLYGNYDQETRTSSIEVLPVESSKGSDAYLVRVLFLEGFQDSAKSWAIMSTFAVPSKGDFECHACQPLIGAALFEKDIQGWKVRAQRKPDFACGVEGAPCNASVFQFGPHQFGLKLSLTAEAQGETGTDVHLLVPWSGYFENAFDGMTEDDNSGDCGRQDGKSPCHVVHRRLQFVASNDNPEFYDLIVESSGTVLKRNLVQDVTGTVRLKFANGKYVFAENVK